MLQLQTFCHSKSNVTVRSTKKCLFAKSVFMSILTAITHTPVISGSLRGESEEQFLSQFVQNNMDKYKHEPCCKSYLAGAK